MNGAEWAAGALTLALVVTLSVAVDAAVGFVAGLAVFPVLLRVADAVPALLSRPARVLRGRPSALDA